MSDLARAASEEHTPSLQLNEELRTLEVAKLRSELRWTRLKRMFFGFFGLIGVFWACFYLWALSSTFGFGAKVGRQAIAVVQVSGKIVSGSGTGGDQHIVRAMRRAFDSASPAVVLLIESPGGAPAAAERISHVLETGRARTGKPVYAVCAGMCASAGYMIAAHADEIYAGRYSLVGSIGAMLSSWNVSQALARTGIEHHVYASGSLKAMLNPFVPIEDQAEDKARSLINEMGNMFEQEITELRGDRVKTHERLFSGEVWTGQQALELGLIDGLGTIDGLIESKFGVSAMAEIVPSRSGPLGWLDSAMESAIHALWLRLH